MKMSDEQFRALESACKPLNTEQNRAAYREGRFPRAERCKDVNMRFRWDIFSACGIDPSPLYRSGLNDSHISTALRRIIPDL